MIANDKRWFIDTGLSGGITLYSGWNLTLGPDPVSFVLILAEFLACLTVFIFLLAHSE